MSTKSLHQNIRYHFLNVFPKNSYQTLPRKTEQQTNNTKNRTEDLNTDKIKEQKNIIHIKTTWRLNDLIKYIEYYTMKKVIDYLLNNDLAEIPKRGRKELKQIIIDGRKFI